MLSKICLLDNQFPSRSALHTCGIDLGVSRVSLEQDLPGSGDPGLEFLCKSWLVRGRKPRTEVSYGWLASCNLLQTVQTQSVSGIPQRFQTDGICVSLRTDWEPDELVGSPVFLRTRDLDLSVFRLIPAHIMKLISQVRSSMHSAF